MESVREVFEAQITIAQSQTPERDLHKLVGSLTSLRLQTLAGPADRLAASVLVEARSDPAVQKQFLDDFSTPLQHRSTEVLEPA